jgi:WD40 repeat protein
VATTAEDSTARLWNAATGAEIAVFSSQNDYLHPVSFSPDSRLVATSTQHSIRLWNAATGDPINEFAGLAPATFSSDSTRLITPARDGITYGAVLWDIASGAKIAGFYGHFAEVYSAQLTADATRILTASADRTARLWRVFPRIQDLVDFSRSILPRDLTAEQRRVFFLE